MNGKQTVGAVEQWLSNNGPQAETGVVFQVYLKGRNDPITVKARYFAPVEGWLTFIHHDADELYAEDVDAEHVAAFPAENVLYVIKRA